MDREHLILREVVETHIDSGDAVGSKMVAARLQQRLSAASIRSVMALLGERGLLVQPHTSAGRVPTDRGYRVYLDDVLARERVVGRRGRSPLAALTGKSPGGLMRGAAAAVAAAIGAAVVVIAPRLEAARLVRLELVWLTETRALALVVTDGGLVHERFVNFERAITRCDLEQFVNYVNIHVPGRGLAEVRERLALARREACDALEAEAWNMVEQVLAPDGEEADEAVIVEGVSRVLAQREFLEAPELARELVQVVEQQRLWMELLEAVAASPDTRVYVGGEVPAPGMTACGLVMSPFQAGQAVGALVAVGPRRMDYRRAVPLVRLAGAELGAMLAAGAL